MPVLNLCQGPPDLRPTLPLRYSRNCSSADSHRTLELAALFGCPHLPYSEVHLPTWSFCISSTPRRDYPIGLEALTLYGIQVGPVL